MEQRTETFVLPEGTMALIAAHIMAQPVAQIVLALQQARPVEKEQSDD